MRKLMKSCPVPVYGLVEGVRPGHLHIIVTGAVEGRRPTDAKIGAGCCDQSVRLRQDQPFRHRGQRLREIWRKSVALIDGEDRNEFEERNAAGRCARLDLGPVLLLTEIGSASGRERVWQYVSLSVVAVSIKNKE